MFFCCNGCGESLKKQKVEQHPFSCRSSVSCIDCNTNFSGNEYKKHTQCMTEAERYQGNLYEAKENKGALKQNSWMESVRHAADACKNNAQLKGLLVRISENDNVPRKKAKFLNFIQNSMRVGNKNLVEKAWEEIEKAGKESSSSVNAKLEDIKPQEAPSSELKDKCKISNSKNIIDDETINNDEESNVDKHSLQVSKKERKKRKRIISESGKIDATSDSQTATFSKKKTKSRDKKASAAIPESLEPNMNHINGITPETPGKVKSCNLSKLIQDLVFEKEEISVKKLKRKVTAAYLETYPHKTPEDVSKLFDRKLTKTPGIDVESGTVSKRVENVS